MGANANCNWIDDDCAGFGGPGGDAPPAANGGPGGPGGHGGVIVLQADTFLGGIYIEAKGASGGKGGKGGDGGLGGKGGDGGNGMDCEFGRYGGSGGKGGKAGQGGLGGEGGNGGSIVIQVKVDASNGNHFEDTSTGTGGKGGEPGTPGSGGPPGIQGATTGVFSSSSECEEPGLFLPIPGPPGDAADDPGTLGTGESGLPGKQQFYITGP